jgi:hypothetical protein
MAVKLLFYYLCDDKNTAKGVSKWNIALREIQTTDS